MKRLLIILFLFNCAYGQMSPFMAVYPVSTPSWGEIRINFSDAAASISKYNTLVPSNLNFSTICGSGAVYTSGNLVDTLGNSTGVTISTISTSNWICYSGNNQTMTHSTNITGGTFLKGMTTAGYQSYWFTYTNSNLQPTIYDSTKPQLRIAGLDPASTYTIKVAGGDGLGFTAQWTARVKSNGSASAGQNINGDATSITAGATFTSITPSASGTIDVYCNAQTGNNLATICGMIITKN